MRFELFRHRTLNLLPAAGKTLGWLCCMCMPLMLSTPVAAHGEDIDSIECAVDLRRAGHFQESIDMLLRMRARHGDSVRLALELVMGHLKAGQYDRADEVLNGIFALSPNMKQNEKLRKLAQMIEQARQNKRLELGLTQTEPEAPDQSQQSHQFDVEVTAYKGFEELTSEFSYLEITEFEDYFQIERKNDQLTSKYYYSAARLKGAYRYNFSESFELFGRPTYAFVSNRFTYFHKQADTLADVHFGYSSIDSSWYVMQPDHWAFNAQIKGKWHNYEGQKTLTELKADMNIATLLYGARVKVGISHNDHTLDLSYTQEFDDDYFIIEQKSRLLSPYVNLSYSVSPSLLISLGMKQKNILSSNYLLEGRVLNYSSTVKYDVTEDLELHLSYHHNDLRYDYYNIENCFDLDSFECLNSGELKRTFTLGSRYALTPHWQLGINAMYMDKKQDNDFGQDQWKRLEAYLRYRF